jgi:hypothetical protein
MELKNKWNLNCFCNFYYFNSATQKIKYMPDAKLQKLAYKVDAQIFIN